MIFASFMSLEWEEKSELKIKTQLRWLEFLLIDVRAPFWMRSDQLLVSDTFTFTRMIDALATAKFDWNFWLSNKQILRRNVSSDSYVSFELYWINFMRAVLHSATVFYVKPHLQNVHNF
jgi:hypothetical protein